MSVLGSKQTAEAWLGDAGRMLALMRELYPICRSITGQGVRDTLAIVGRHIPLEISEVPSGTPVFDWEVPAEWNVREAYIARNGERIVDFKRHNLHLVSYSTPVRATMTLEELRPHLHSLPDHPEWIPYRTSYYRRNWGFCLPHRQLMALVPGEYEVVIDSTLNDSGSLTYAECVVPGESAEEVLLSTHICHPSLANDNCAGIALMTLFAQALRQERPRLTYRFLFTPGTIGSITWLSRNTERARALRAGLVVGLVGNSGPLSFKRSRRGDTEIDRIGTEVVHGLERTSRVLAFSPYGYDERQYCSPGFDLAVGRLTRYANDEYPEYHSSADNMDLVSAGSLAGAAAAVAGILTRVDDNRTHRHFLRACRGIGKRQRRPHEMNMRHREVQGCCSVLGLTRNTARRLVH